MARIASEALIERLADWGVDTVSACPETGSTGSFATTLFRDKIQQLRS